MAVKAPKIAEFRDRITLCQVQWKIDDELNRKEVLVPVAERWASVTAKTSNINATQTGTRPEIVYSVVLRKTNVDFEYAIYKGTTCALKAPKYDVDNKYTYFEMTKLDSKEHAVIGNT